MFAAPSATQKELFDDKSTWMINHLQAEANGMAVRIRVSQTDLKRGFSRIIVVGIRSPNPSDEQRLEGQNLLEQMINSHHYSTGLSFIPFGTPTNNTQTCSSGHSESTEDLERSYETEILGIRRWDEPKTNAQCLGRALGLATPEVFRYIAHVGDTADSYAQEMQTAIWPDTGDYFLRYLLPDFVRNYDLQMLGQYFTKFVRGSGPLPAIRVGDQPYGILPVTCVRRKSDNQYGWEASPLDNSGSISGTIFDNKLHSILYHLYEKWFCWANDPMRVPRIRSIKDFLKVIRTWICCRSCRWNQSQSAIAPDLLLTSASLDGCWSSCATMFSVIQHMLGSRPFIGCRNGRRLGGPIDTKWQLRDLLERSLGLADASCFSANIVRDAICSLSNSSILDFFNSATKPEQIVRRIKDDPTFGIASSRAYGVRRSLARRIVGVGKDTFHDILYSFGDQKPTPDIDRLFRETLDLCTHRLDAWITSMATKRLEAMRDSQPTGIYLGAYGWVENLKPNYVPYSAGYVHAPSRGQAVAAAVLHNAYLKHNYNDGQANDVGSKDPNPFCINLNSERVRRGMHILERVGQGQPLGALLGYQFERALHELHLDLYVDDFRKAFPLVANKETDGNPDDPVELIAARNVVDGLALARTWRDLNNGERCPGSRKVTDIIALQLNEFEDESKLGNELCRLLSSMDAVSDLLMYEGVYQMVQGNYERGGAALDSASGNAYPPEIESVITPVSGKRFQVVPIIVS